MPGLGSEKHRALIGRVIEHLEYIGCECRKEAKITSCYGETFYVDVLAKLGHHTIIVECGKTSLERIESLRYRYPHATLIIQPFGVEIPCLRLKPNEPTSIVLLK